jgi:hypothetical protein
MSMFRKEAEELDEALPRHRAAGGLHGSSAKPLGPFARIDATEIAQREGKTRGVISNLFGSQGAFQVAVMDLSLSDFEDQGGVHEVAYPDVQEFSDAGSWLAAFAEVESARGPRHRVLAEGYSARWLLWVAMLPYEVWSPRMSEVSVVEFESWVGSLESDRLAPALSRFGLAIRPGVELRDLATAFANAIEGVWLSQCTHPDAARGANQMFVALSLLWHGATSAG